MLGLFGLLNLGSRSLATERQGVEVAGHNLANVNNPEYARQRLSIATSATVDSDFGPQGTGVDSVAIVRLRNEILDNQIQIETSVRGSLEAQQSALQYGQTQLGQRLDRTSASADSSSVGTSHSLGDGLSDLFTGFQGLATNPASLDERQTVLIKASELAGQFNQIDQRLGALNTSLNNAVQDDTDTANSLLTQIASLNGQISKAELNSPGQANDLRDTRQSRIEDLAKLVKIDLSDGNYGAIDVTISGTLMVSGNQAVESLETYDPGNGQLLLRAATTDTPLGLTGGSIQGTIDARDGALADLRSNINSLAAVLISEVNSAHAPGVSLTGSTGANFFTGTNASNIQVNAALLADPKLLQAAGSGSVGAAGDNRAVLAMAQLGQKAVAALGNQTFNARYSETTTAFGQALSSVNSQLSDQQAMEKMLLQQRDSISGVSLDEEMTDLVKYQRAFQASARLITTVDELLDTVVNLKR